jgi:hypothetical protein
LADAGGDQGVAAEEADDSMTLFCGALTNRRQAGVPQRSTGEERDIKSFCPNLQ